MHSLSSKRVVSIVIGPLLMVMCPLPLGGYRGSPGRVGMRCTLCGSGSPSYDYLLSALSFDGLFITGTLLSLALFLLIARHLRKESHRISMMHTTVREQRVLRALPIYCLLVDVLVYTDETVVYFTD